MSAFQNIPSELRTPALWLQYYLSPVPQHPEKKARKHPTVKYSTPQDRQANLRTLDKLLERPATNGGLQRWIDKTEGFTYIDIDRVRNPENGEVEAWALELIKELDSYCEISASGKGFHLVARATLPRDFHVAPGQVEIYSGNTANKLLAMTGDVFEKYNTIQDRQDLVVALLNRLEGQATVQPAPSPVVVSIEWISASEIEPEPLLWLWENRIPLGKLTVFCGPPDTGKSTVATDIAARGTQSRKWPDSDNEHMSFDVLMLVSEDDLADTVVPRLMVAGADLERIHFAKKTIISDQAKRAERQIALDTDLAAIEDVLRANCEIKLVILDPISSYLGKLKKNGEEDIRWMLTQMKELAERTGVAVISIDHFNKNIQQAGIHRLSGAGALGAVPRAVWAFVKDDDDEEKLTRLMLNAKCNVVSEAKKAGLKYRFKTTQLTIKERIVDLAVIDWLGKSDSDLDEVLHKQSDWNKDKGQLGKCETWLESRLAAGPVLSREIYREAEKEGYSERTVKRAVAELRIDSKKCSDGWRMGLPQACQKEEGQL